MANDGLDLADREAEAAVAHDRDAARRRTSEGSADGAGESIAERAMGAVGDEIAARFENLVVRRHIGTGRAGVGDDHRVARQNGVELADDALRPDGGFVAERVELECAALVGARFRDDGAAISRRAWGRADRQRLFQHLQGQLRIADESVRGRIVGRDHHRVGVDMHDRNRRRRRAPVLGRGRTRAAADEDDEVGAVHHRARRRHAAVGADDPGAERMILREAALAADGGADRRAEQQRDAG